MVMEAPPSPQSVGREFVRQYYTLLNKAPNHLHRFYNHQSSFVHGGLDPNRETSPVIGQKQIHQKIQQLNFHDCHAKITQVDSQATLGGGVVVQVTGELSNAGQPMRRFTQTFVLAAQSPKKYYVHNDIFRYQDEIITDEECEQENRSEPEIEDNQQRDCQVIQDVPIQQQQPAVIPFFGANAAMQPATGITHIQPPPHVLPPAVATAAAVSVNGTVHPDDINNFQGGVTGVPPHVVNPTIPMATMQPNIMNIEDSTPIKIDENSEVCGDHSESGQIMATSSSFDETEPRSDYQNEAISSSEPKTYANLLKSSPFNSPPLNREINVVTIATTAVTSTTSQFQNVRSTSPVASNVGNTSFNHRNRSNNRNNGSNGSGSGQIGGNTRLPRQDSLRPVKNLNSEESGDDRRRSQSNNYSDINQLFLGNLPLNANEEELREIFIEFGSISDLKVHSKSGKPGMPGARTTPNYGFITFETYQGMQNCLAARPIYYPKGDKSGTLLNVEEKKMKDRQSYGGRLNNDRERNRDRDKRGPNNGLNRSSIGNNGGAGTLPGGPNNRSNNYRNGNRGPNTYNNRR